MDSQQRPELDGDGQGEREIAGATAEITVALDLRSEELCGVVRRNGAERRFVGWLALIDSLQRAAEEARAGQTGPAPVK